MSQLKQIIRETQLLQRTLSEVSRIFVSISAFNFESKVQQALQICGETVNADRVYIFKYEHELQVTNNTYEWCAEGIEPQIEHLQQVPFDDFQEWLKAHKAGEYIYVEDVLALPKDHEFRLILEPQGIRSLIALPMMLDDFCYGFIGLDSVREVHHYSEIEIMLLSELSNTFLVALERKEAEEGLLKEKERFKATLLSVGDGVIATDSNGRIQVINDVAQELMGINIKQAIEQDLSKVFKVIDGKSSKIIENIGERVFYTKEELTLDKDVFLQSTNNTHIPIQGKITPLKDSDGKVNGVVVVFRDYTEQRNKEKEIEFLSFHDHLTGLYNRRYMDDAMQRIDTSRNLPISIIMIDINDLKLINDNYGHQQGDDYIRKAGVILKEICRSDDIVARMGGDEVHILLPKTDAKTAQAIRKRILDNVKEAFPNSRLDLFAVGIATKTNQNQDIKELIKIADLNMYQHKQELKQP